MAVLRQLSGSSSTKQLRGEMIIGLPYFIAFLAMMSKTVSTLICDCSMAHISKCFLCHRRFELENSPGLPI